MASENMESEEQALYLDATPSSGRSLEGIDIGKALDILSSRNSHDYHHSHDDHSHHPGPGCHVNVPEEVKYMGQTIDLNQESISSVEQAQKEVEEISHSIEVKREKLGQARWNREIEIRAKLESMSVGELLHAAMEAQESRVSAYRDYDRGLETVLKTGNISNYPLVCASATASFSVLSDTIKIIDSVLIDKHNRPDLSRLLTTLQQHEREKLNVTAALHLEQVRQKDELSATGDDRVANLLREGVASLKQRANICIESINEVLEDLRYAIADEMEK